MNDRLKACLAGAFILLITLLLLSKCSSCRDRREYAVVEPPADTVAVVEDSVPQDPEDEPVDVEDIGGNGDLKIVLTWEFPGDIDIHVTQPTGTIINFMNKIDMSTGGNLDVDNLQGGSPGRPAAENVYWPHPPQGLYRVEVKFYGDRPGGENGGNVLVTVFNNGQRSEYPVTLHYVGQQVHVVDIDYRPR